jgi:beta-glucosidase
MMGGVAVGRALFGMDNPGGKVPATYYNSTSQLPPMGLMNLYPNASAGSNGITYRYFLGQATFPFGHGLSYTRFELSQAQLSASKLQACDTATWTVLVTNVGTVAGDEVVQAYVQQANSSTPAPSVRLAAFQRVTLQPGQSTSVQLHVAPSHRTVVQDGVDIYSGTYFLEEGPVIMSVGTSLPPHAPGHGLSQQVMITSSAPLSACSKPMAGGSLRGV